MAITEHPVEMELWGSPRWWTVTNDEGSREIVRVVLKKGQHYSLNGVDPDAPEEGVLFALLPVGEYQWPPLVPLDDWRQKIADAIDATHLAHKAAHAHDTWHGTSENTSGAHAAIHDAKKTLERAGRLLGFAREEA